MNALGTPFRRPFLSVIKKIAASASALNTRPDSNQADRCNEIAINIAIYTNSDH